MKKYFREIYLFLILGCFMVSAVRAQTTTGASTTTITIDTVNRVMKDAVLQDRPLLIIYPLGSATADFVWYYPIDNDGRAARITRREYRQLVIKRQYLREYSDKGPFFQL